MEPAQHKCPLCGNEDEIHDVDGAVHVACGTCGNYEIEAASWFNITQHGMQPSESAETYATLLANLRATGQLVPRLGDAELRLANPEPLIF